MYGISAWILLDSCQNVTKAEVRFRVPSKYHYKIDRPTSENNIANYGQMLGMEHLKALGIKIICSEPFQPGAPVKQELQRPTAMTRMRQRFVYGCSKHYEL